MDQNSTKIIKTLKEFSINILKNDYNSSYVQRKNLERVLIENITLDNLNPQLLETKTFTAINDLFYVIYILLKCFDAYDKFEKIHKQIILNYLESIDNNVYNFDITSLIKNIINFEEDEKFKFILNINKDLKNIFKNLNIFENVMKIKKETFLYEDDQFFQNAIQSISYLPRTILPIKKEEVVVVKQEDIKPKKKVAKREKKTEIDLKRRHSSINNSSIKRKDIKKEKIVKTKIEQQQEKDSGNVDNINSMPNRKRKRENEGGGEEEEEEEKKYRKIEKLKDDELINDDESITIIDNDNEEEKIQILTSDDENMKEEEEIKNQNSLVTIENTPTIIPPTTSTPNILATSSLSSMPTVTLTEKETR